MNDAIIIKAIYNEYNLYKYHNKKKGNLINKFRPYSNKVTDYLLLVLSFFFVPIVPFIPFFNKVSISTSSYDCNMYFICSEKSKIIFSKNTKSNFIDITRGDKYHVTLKGYLNYLKVIYLFFYTIRLKIWFYPSVTLLYQMIRIYGYLSENKGSIKEINITNHYDRWAIFFGEIANEFDIKLNIYQHGILDCDYKPFYKIPKVNNVYAYDELSGNIFSCDLILDCNKVIIKKPTVGVAEVKKHKKSVLIIGTVDVTYLTIEKKIISNLGADIFIYYKPHPLNHSDCFFLYRDTFQLLGKNELLPLVDIVIHTNSTLALEYSGNDIYADYIDLYQTNNIQDVFNKINKVFL